MMDLRSGSRFFLLLLLMALLGCARPQHEVVLYTSADSFVAQPIVRDFEKASGIRVVMLGDTEANKGAGLAKKLVAEKSSPRCDVFWNSELLRTLVLKDRGVLAPYASPSAADIPAEFKDKEGYWHGFAARARVVIYNRKLAGDAPPRSLQEFADPKWRGPDGAKLAIEVLDPTGGEFVMRPLRDETRVDPHAKSIVDSNQG